MELSDDEAEAPSLSVSNYHFVDDNDEPVSFSVLPIQWSEGERIGGERVRVFLHGMAGNGLQRIFKHVIAWKFELSNEKPEILVLSKDNNWIKLQNPKKSFEETVRSILITVHSLHFVMRKADASGKSLWGHILKRFSLHEVRPFESDLVDHLCLISEAFRRNDALAKSKFLVQFLNKNCKKRKLLDEDFEAKTASRFVVDIEDDIVDVAEEDESGESHDIYDDVCAFCDEGGDLLCCEGRCLRSFHATTMAVMAAKSHCDSLGLTEEEVDAIPNFLCKNCEYKQHQCFICGVLGSSDTSSGSAQVFSCASVTCGQFYHPHCLSKLVHQDNKDSAEELEKKIAEGRSFTCPIHTCCICKQGENKKDHNLQFAVCRRCPKSYHRKCLPRKIAFKGNKKEGIVRRAWKDALPDRILIYCLDHEMDERIRTPARDHIKFPNVEEKKNATEKRKTGVEEKKRNHTSSKSPGDSRKVELKMRVSASKERDDRTAACETPKRNEKPYSAVKGGGNKDIGELSSHTNIPTKVHVNDAPQKELKSSTAKENKSLQKSGKQETTKTVHNTSEEVKPVTENLSGSFYQLDADAERRLLDSIEDDASSMHLEDIREKYGVSSPHTSSLKDVVNKTITVEKVESSVELVQTALQLLEEGCSVEDAKAVCRPELLRQIFNWKNQLDLYLSPILPGVDNTFFSQHFTVVRILLEVVDKLHCYVREDDMIVNICCSANDFSLLMKNKLEETGKKCLFKNYYLVQDKNDNNSEQRDWMTVQHRELPTGSKLIMVLNLSSGVEAALANKFINKALEFKPKILLLILPQEAQRSRKSISSYYLVWEDSQLLSGKSFYLSGSANTIEKQTELSNMKPSVLYLWSRCDWSDKHKYIADGYHHISRQQELTEISCPGNPILNHPTRDRDNYDTKSKPTNGLRRHEGHKSPERRKNESEKKSMDQQKVTKKCGGEKVQTATECKSEMSPKPEYGRHDRQNFGNCPMQSGTAYEGKRARTSDKKFRRHRMTGAEHETSDHYGATKGFGNRQHIDGNEEKLRKDSEMQSGTADGGKRARTSDEKFRRHSMTGAEHGTSDRKDSDIQSGSADGGKQGRTSDEKFRRHSMIGAEHGTSDRKDFDIQSDSADGGKRARTSDKKCRRHSMTGAEHGTSDRYGETKEFGNRQHIDGNEEKLRKDSDMRSGIANGGKRARTSDEKCGRHDMKGADHGTDHNRATKSFGNRQHIGANEDKLRKESSTELGAADGRKQARTSDEKFRRHNMKGADHGSDHNRPTKSFDNGQCVDANVDKLRKESDTESGTADRRKQATISDEKFRRHNMKGADHGTYQNRATKSFENRQCINEDELRKESNTQSRKADGGKRVITEDGEFRRHNMDGAEHRTDHDGAITSFGNKQQINGNEVKLRKKTRIQSPISLHGQKDSCPSGSNQGQNAGQGHPPKDDGSELPGHRVPAGFALGPNEAYSHHHSAGWLDE